MIEVIGVILGWILMAIFFAGVVCIVTVLAIGFALGLVAILEEIEEILDL